MIGFRLLEAIGKAPSPESFRPDLSDDSEAALPVGIPMTPGSRSPCQDPPTMGR